jgi:hypothetical protein
MLLDQPFSAQLSPQLVMACAEGRPVVLLEDEQQGISGPQRQERLERWRLSLLSQLRELAVVRARSGCAGDSTWAQSTQGRSAPALAQALERISSGFDSQFDTRIDGEQLLARAIEPGWQELLGEVLSAVRHGPAQPGRQPGVQAFAASYGEGAHLLFDFRARLVFIDPLAQQYLRVRRELPQPAPGVRPCTDALVRELDATLWDLGIAAGPHTLLDQPADWWHCSLRWVAEGGVERYSRIPRHLDLTRRLLQGPATPSELRRHARVGVGDLRRFIQACLMGRLLQWAPASQDQPTGAH